jgi:hypothetical protein
MCTARYTTTRKHNTHQLRWYLCAGGGDAGITISSSGAGDASTGLVNEREGGAGGSTSALGQDEFSTDALSEGVTNASLLAGSAGGGGGETGELLVQGLGVLAVLEGEGLGTGSGGSGSRGGRLGSGRLGGRLGDGSSVVNGRGGSSSGTGSGNAGITISSSGAGDASTGLVDERESSAGGSTGASSQGELATNALSERVTNTCLFTISASGAGSEASEFLVQCDRVLAVLEGE